MVRLASFLDERKEPIATPLAPRVKVIKISGSEKHRYVGNPDAIPPVCSCTFGELG